MLRFVALLAFLQAVHFISGQFINAKCRIDPVTSPGADNDTQPVSGTIFLTQSLWGGKTKLLIRLDGFTKTHNVTRHGFHVHVNGNVSNQCTAAGGHFNPLNITHGAPWDTSRHVGDLGNLEVKCGRIRAIVRDLEISLNSRDDNSVLNRTLVVHAQVDDLGKGNESDSLTTGHAGARLGCCVVKKVENFSKKLTAACSGKSARKYPEVCDLKERREAAKKRRLASSKYDTSEEDDDDSDEDEDAACRPPRPTASAVASWRQARQEARKERNGSSSGSNEKSSASKRRHHHRHNRRHRD